MLVALETVVRVRAWIRHGTHSPVREYIQEKKTGLKIPKPSSVQGPIRINSLGFRGPEVPLQKPLKTIRLAFLGGSTTWCAEVSNNEMVWPHLVWEGLQQKFPGKNFDYVNGAFTGYSTKESLLTLQTRVAKTNPDIIFIYHATNDLAYDTRNLAESQGIFSKKAAAPSWLANWSMAWNLIEKNIQLHFRKNQINNKSELLHFTPSQISKNFRRRLSDLIQHAKAISPLVVIATFTHQFRREQNPDEQLRAAEVSIFYMPYMDLERLFQGFEEYNNVIREVANQENIILIEEENEIPGNTLYFNDSIHFKDAGSQKMAARILKRLLTNTQFLQFMENT